jgi:hypothetical protein
MEPYIYQRLSAAGEQGQITFSKSALNEIYKFSRGIPRLINLICDRALLGGFVEETFHVDNRIIKRAKDSLLGKEESSKPFLFLASARTLTPLRIALLTIFVILLAGMILANRGYFSSFRDTKNLMRGRIQDVYFQIFGIVSPSASTIPLDGKGVQDSMKNQTLKESEETPLEVSK